MVKMEKRGTRRINGVIVGVLCLFALAACATTDEQRFPLDWVSGQQAAYQIDTAREALPAYQRMGADLERQGRLADAAQAYSNAVISAFALGRLQDALDASQKAVEMAERSGSPLHLGVALVYLGSTYVSLGAVEKTIPLFERGALAGRRAGNPKVEAVNYGGLSSV